MTEDLLTHERLEIRLGFIENFFGTLVAPMQTFRRLAFESRSDTSQLPGAFCIVTLVSALDALRLTPVKQMSWAIVNVPLEITGGLLLWVLLSSVVSLAAFCFGVEMSKVRAAFVTLGWSLVPWIFLSPVACFWKILGPAHVIFMIIPLIWIRFLQIVAIKESFAMRIWQALLLVLLLPPLLSWYQMMQFFQSLAATAGSLLN